MKKFPVFYVEAASRSDLKYHTVIFNSFEIQYYLWISIPSGFDKNFVLYDFEYIEGPGNSDNLFENIIHESGKWYRIQSSILGIESVGQYIYSLNFINKVTDEVVKLYIDFILQSNHPEKPYLYMK